MWRLAHVVERFRRRDFGHMDIEVTIDDPKTSTRPFSFTQPQTLLPDTDLWIVFSVASTSVVSPGAAEAMQIPKGTPAPSTTTMHFEPLPRRVFPMAEPLFSPARRSRR